MFKHIVGIKGNNYPKEMEEKYGPWKLKMIYIHIGGWSYEPKDHCPPPTLRFPHCILKDSYSFQCIKLNYQNNNNNNTMFEHIY